MASKSIYPVVAALGIAAASWLTWKTQVTTPAGTSVLSAQSGAGADKTKGAALRAMGVEVVTVQPQMLRYDVQAVGSLRAGQSVMLRPEVVGRVAAMHFKDGATVRRGQLLVQLDDTLARADVQQAQAQLSVAQSSFKRTQELVAAQFMAQQTLDAASANVQVAQAQLALAQARLARMGMRAPFDAVAGIRLVNVGDYVKDGADLVALEDTRQMVVDFRLPERYAEQLKIGQRVEVTLDAQPGQLIKTQVSAIEPVLDVNARSLALRATLPRPKAIDAGWRSGMFARVSVLLSSKEAALLVPEEAVVPQGGKQTVIKVLAAGQQTPAAGPLPPDTQGVSRRQEVKLGVRRAGKVEVTAGLLPGDTVVVAGQQRLQKDGSPLRIIEPGKPADPAAAPTKLKTSAGQ